MQTQFEKTKQMYWASGKGQKIKDIIREELFVRTQHMANPHHIHLIKTRINNKFDEKIQELVKYIEDDKKNIANIILRDELENIIWVKKQIKESIQIIEKTIEL
jgi:hypothetical protein